MELHIIENVATRSDAERCTDSQEIPRLNYSLRERKWRIILFWSFILLDSLIMPIGLYFSLWYLVGPGAPGNQILNASQVFGILTATLCGTSILEYVIRLYDLCKRHSSCRVSVPTIAESSTQWPPSEEKSPILVFTTYISHSETYTFPGSRSITVGS